MNFLPRIRTTCFLFFSLWAIETGFGQITIDLDAIAGATAGGNNQGTGANGSAQINISELAAAAGVSGEIGILNLAEGHICLDLGINRSGTGICLHGSDGGNSGNLPDGAIISRSAVFSDELNHLLASVSLPSVLSQRLLAQRSMDTATRDIGARLLGFRIPGLDEEPAPDLVVTGPKNTVSAAKNTAVVSTERERVFRFFVQGDPSNFDLDSYGYAAGGIEINAIAGTTGLEYHLSPEILVGLAGSWVETDSRLGGGLGDSDASGFIASAFVSYHRPEFYADLLYAYGWLDHDIRRGTLAGEDAIASTSSRNQIARFNTGLNHKLGPFVVGPYASLVWTTGEIGSYTESGSGLLNLRVSGQDYNSLASQLGLHIALPIETGFGEVIPQIRGAWIHEYLNDGGRVTARPVSFPANTFSGVVPQLDSDYGLAGAGLLFRFGEDFSLSFDYEMAISSSTTIQAGTAAVAIEF